jgi:Na+/proline symporter
MPESRKERRQRSWWYLLLLVQFAAVLWPPFFNKARPFWIDIPFFYWIQLLCVIAGAVLTAIVYVAVPTQYAIYLQLLAGIWIIQTLPAVMLGAFTSWSNGWALLVGWAAGTLVGTAMAIAVNLTPIYPLQFAGYVFPGYTALTSVILNVTLVIVLTPFSTR